MRSLNLGLAFLLELCLLAAIVDWGLQLDTPSVARWLVAIGAAAALALTWTLVAAPTAKRRLPGTPLIGFKLLVFTIGAVLLYSTGRHLLAILLESLVLANLALAVVWDQT